MYKKTLLGLILFIGLAFSFNFCFAADGVNNMMNHVQNAASDTGNAIEGAAKDVSNTSKNVTGGIANTMGNMTRNGSVDRNGNGNGNGYNTTRVATDTTGNNLMGMTDTTWTWLIVGITAIAIIALIWYYSMQFTNNRDNDDSRMD